MGREYSGWGDPAFEVVELLTTPTFLATSAAQRDAFVAAYAAARASSDPGVATRIRIYYFLMLSRWAVRFARYLYEVPRGIDRRLPIREPDWEHTTRRKYARYLERADAALARG